MNLDLGFEFEFELGIRSGEVSSTSSFKFEFLIDES